MSKTSLVIILLATIALAFLVPAVSGVSLLQHAKAETSGQNGMYGPNFCPIQPYSPAPAGCNTRGGFGGSYNLGNLDQSSNGNGGPGGIIVRCDSFYTCVAYGGNGGGYNSENSGTSSNGNGGVAARLAAATTEPTTVLHLAGEGITQVTILIIPELQGMVMGGMPDTSLNATFPISGIPDSHYVKVMEQVVATVTAIIVPVTTGMGEMAVT
jgi:hypothetical protein